MHALRLKILRLDRGFLRMHADAPPAASNDSNGCADRKNLGRAPRNILGHISAMRGALIRWWPQRLFGQVARGLVSREAAAWLFGLSVLAALALLVPGLLPSISPNHGRIIELGPEVTSVRVDSGVEYRLEPPDAPAFSAASIAALSEGWASVDQRTLNLKGEGRAVWVRFTVRVMPGAIQPWILSVDWPFLDRLDIHVRDAQSGQWLSDSLSGLIQREGGLPFTFNFVPDRPADVEIYLRAHATAQLLLPIRISRDDIYRSHRLVENLLLGLVLGVLAAMCAYSLSLYVFTQESRYAFYALYVGSIALYIVTLSGLGAVYLWGAQSWLRVRDYGVFSSVAFLCASIFIRQFLSLPKRGGWLLWVADLVVGFWLIVVVLYLTINPRWALKLEDFGAYASCVVGLGIPLVIWREGEASGRYLTIAWAFLIASTFLLMMGLSGVISYEPEYLHIQYVGFMLEAMLLSLALAERINRDRRERLAAQSLSLQLAADAQAARERELQAERKALETEREAREWLAIRVDERTRELRDALQALERANVELDALSRIDGLTGLSNRRHFDQALVAAFSNAAKTGRPLAVILGDIDHFKRLNDTWGHQAGDICLQQVAAVWKATARRGADVAARYGGEELVMLLPDTERSAALEIAEQLRRQVEQLRCDHDGHAIVVHISLGVAVCTPGRDDAPASLLEAADQALYRAKAGGRNRVEGAPGV